VAEKSVAIEPGDVVDALRGIAGDMSYRHRALNPVGPCVRHCRLVVKRERFEQKWPKGDRFRKFAARVADRAMALGAVPLLHDAEWDQYASESNRAWFRLGLRTEPEMVPPEWYESPYFCLGQEYRRRFS